MTKRHPKSKPPPAATPGGASKLLDKARKEVVKDPRQAAEKGWLAAVTAVRALLRSAGEEWMSSQRVKDRLLKFETKRNLNHALSGRLEDFAEIMHGSIFYKGDVDLCKRETVERWLGSVEVFIDDASVLCRLMGRRRFSTEGMR